MDQLNSFLIEGTVISDVTPEKTTKDKVTQISFDMTNKYKRIIDNNTIDQVNTFTVLASHRQAELAIQYLKKGRNIRVIGRMICEKNCYYIDAEQIEMQPRYKS